MSNQKAFAQLRKLSTKQKGHLLNRRCTDGQQAHEKMLNITNRQGNANQNYEIGFPWWRSGWESTCLCRGHGFEPWSRRIPHAAEQLSPCITTAEPVL